MIRSWIGMRTFAIALCLLAFASKGFSESAKMEAIKSVIHSDNEEHRHKLKEVKERLKVRKKKLIEDELLVAEKQSLLSEIALNDSVLKSSNEELMYLRARAFPN